MLTFLANITTGGGAQARGDTNIFENVIAIFSRPDTLAYPEDLLHSLETLSVVWSVIFLTAGVVCMLQGYRIYKTVTVVLALAIGAFAGYKLGQSVNAEYIVSGCMGALLAVTCFRLMKYAVAIMGGLAGAFLSANAWTAITRLVSTDADAAATVQYYWICSLVGLLFGGMLAFILFKISVVLFTSVSGATIAVLGGVALLLQIPGFGSNVYESVAAHPVVVPLLVLVPALIGFILQESQVDQVGVTKPTPKPA